jgi:uncharacterized protein (DUF2147 family)
MTTYLTRPGLIGLFSLLSLGFSFAQTDRVVGIWLNEEREGRIEIFKKGDRYFGKLVWLKEPNAANGKPKVDDKNPDASLRSRPILGLLFMENFSYDGDDVWSGGSIYDARGGKTYRCKMTLKDPKTLDVRGYIGISLLGRTTTWTRVGP